MTCEVCGKQSAQCFEVHLGGEKHVFDSFECAMRAFALHCGSCGDELIGHGIVLGDTIYCSYTCANDDHIRNYKKHIIMNERANF